MHDFALFFGGIFIGTVIAVAVKAARGQDISDLTILAGAACLFVSGFIAAMGDLGTGLWLGFLSAIMIVAGILLPKSR